MHLFFKNKLMYTLLSILLFFTAFNVYSLPAKAATTLPIKVDIPSGYQLVNGSVEAWEVDGADLIDWDDFSIKDDTFTYPNLDYLESGSKVVFFVDLQLKQGEDMVTYVNEVAYTKQELLALKSIPVNPSTVLVDFKKPNGFQSQAYNHYIKSAYTADAHHDFSGEKIMVKPQTITTVAQLVDQENNGYLLLKENNPIAENSTVSFANEINAAKKISLNTSGKTVGLAAMDITFKDNYDGHINAISGKPLLNNINVTPGKITPTFTTLKGSHLFKWERGSFQLSNDTSFPFTGKLDIKKYKSIDYYDDSLSTEIEVKSGEFQLVTIKNQNNSSAKDIPIKIYNKNNTLVETLSTDDVNDNYEIKMKHTLSPGSYRVETWIPEYKVTIKGSFKVPKFYRLTNLPTAYYDAYFSHMTVLELSNDKKSVTSRHTVTPDALVTDLKIDKKKQYIVIPSFYLETDTGYINYYDMVQLSGDKLLKLNSFSFNHKLKKPTLKLSKLHLKQEIVDFSASIKGSKVNFTKWDNGMILPALNGLFTVSQVNKNNQFVYLSQKADLKKATTINLESKVKSLIPVKVKLDKKTNMMFAGIKNSDLAGIDQYVAYSNEINYLVQPGKHHFEFSTTDTKGNLYYWMTKEYNVKKKLSVSCKPSYKLSIGIDKAKLKSKGTAQWVALDYPVKSKDIWLTSSFKGTGFSSITVSLLDKKGKIVGKNHFYYLQDNLKLTTHNLKAGTYTLKIEIPKQQGSPTVLKKTIKVVK